MTTFNSVTLKSSIGSIGLDHQYLSRGSKENLRGLNHIFGVAVKYLQKVKIAFYQYGSD